MQGSRTPRRLYANDLNVLRVRGQRLEVVRIGCEHRPARFSDSNDQRVNSRATSSASSQQCRSASQCFGDVLDHFADLQELVLDSVPTAMPLQTLDQYEGRDARRPQALVAKCLD
jgi:hypothetical protein